MGRGVHDLVLLRSVADQSSAYCTRSRLASSGNASPAIWVLKCAFDAQGLLNPGKVFPTLHRCAELGRMHVHGGKLAFPDLPRF